MRSIILITCFLLNSCAHVPNQVLVEKCGKKIGNPSAQVRICKFIQEVND